MHLLTLNIPLAEETSMAHLQHHVGVVVGFDVVEPHDAREVGGSVIRPVQLALLIQPRDVRPGEGGLQHILRTKRCQYSHINRSNRVTTHGS